MHFDNYDSLNNIKISIIHFGIIKSHVVSLMKKIQVYFSTGNKGVDSNEFRG
jgi:methyl coenzyme M reductase subunit C